MVKSPVTKSATEMAQTAHCSRFCEGLEMDDMIAGPFSPHTERGYRKGAWLPRMVGSCD